jgi:hypothetical protein
MIFRLVASFIPTLWLLVRRSLVVQGRHGVDGGQRRSPEFDWFIRAGLLEREAFPPNRLYGFEDQQNNDSGSHRDCQIVRV